MLYLNEIWDCVLTHYFLCLCVTYKWYCKYIVCVKILSLMCHFLVSCESLACHNLSCYFLNVTCHCVYSLSVNLQKTLILCSVIIITSWFWCDWCSKSLWNRGGACWQFQVKRSFDKEKSCQAKSSSQIHTVVFNCCYLPPWKYINGFVQIPQPFPARIGVTTHQHPFVATLMIYHYCHDCRHWFCVLKYLIKRIRSLWVISSINLVTDRQEYLGNL